MNPVPSAIDNLDGRVALVTGGGRGIGRAVALTLASRGANVAVTSRSHDQIEETAAAIRDQGGAALAVRGDVTDATSMDEVAATVGEHLGPVDILVINAGSLLFKPLVPLPGLRPPDLPGFAEPTSDAEWRSQIDVHLTGAFNVLRAVGPSMLERRYGRVVTIGSVAASRSARFNTAYEAAKGGLATLTRSVAKEWARFDVTVNCIAAGHFPTSMTTELHESEQGQAWLKTRVPMRRVGELWEIASLALFLAGPASAFMTGQVIHLDGGESL